MNINQFVAEPDKFHSLQKFSAQHIQSITDKKKASGYWEKYLKKMQDYQERL